MLVERPAALNCIKPLNWEDKYLEAGKHILSF